MLRQEKTRAYFLRSLCVGFWKGSSIPCWYPLKARSWFLGYILCAAKLRILLAQPSYSISCWFLKGYKLPILLFCFPWFLKGYILVSLVLRRFYLLFWDTKQKILDKSSLRVFLCSFLLRETNKGYSKQFFLVLFELAKISIQKLLFYNRLQKIKNILKKD